MNSQLLTKKQNQGFTLVEVIIVTAIIAILAAIAIPNYQESVKKSRRADAKSALLGFAAAMERSYTINGNYNGNDTTTAGVPDSGFYASETPIEGSAKFYDLSFTYTTVTFTLYAKPKSAQAGDGPFLLTHTGKQGWAKEASNSATDAQYTEDW